VRISAFLKSFSLDGETQRKYKSIIIRFNSRLLYIFLISANSDYVKGARYNPKTCFVITFVIINTHKISYNICRDVHDVSHV